MKTKHLLMGALAFPFMFAACTNDDFETSSMNNQTVEGDMIELPENFTFTGAKVDNGVDTRAGYDQGSDGLWYMGWYPVRTDGSAIDLAYLQDQNNWDKIGLAWLNVTNDGKVYTNYELSHYGWLNSGATGAITDPCNDNVLTNGVWFNGTSFSRWNASTETVVDEDGFEASGNYAFEETNFTAAGVDANRGMFRTTLSTIFGGEYLVYYPFNSELKDIDYLTAVMGKEFTNTQSSGTSVEQDYQSWIGPHAFMFGKTNVVGGTQASDFTLGQLSGMIAVNVKGVNGAALSNLSTVVLYAPEGGFYTSVKLDATKIQNGATDAAQGKNLYVAGAQGNEITKTLISHAFQASGVSTDATYGETFGFPALPVELNGVRILVYDKDGNTSEAVVQYGMDNGVLTVNPGQWTNIAVVTTQPTSDQMYAYDETSFKQALAKANSVSTPVTIHLLGTVELTGVLTIPGNVKVAAETEADKLVLTSGEGSRTVVLAQDGAEFDCDVDIQGEGCCQLYPAELRMNGDLAVNRTITNEGGKIQFGFNATTVRKVTSEINGTINNLVDLNDETNIGDIDINAYTTVQLNGTLTNNGTIDIATAGTGLQNDDAALNVFGTLINNNEVTLQGNLSTGSNGTFANNDIFTVKVSAQITGKGVTEQADNAQYICEVNSVVRYNDAINNNPMTAAHRTTLVRFIEGSNYTYVLEPNIDNGQIVNVDGDVINFESKIPADQVLQLQNEVEGAEPVATTIGNLTIVNGGFELEHAALTMANFEINHEEAIGRWTRIEQKLNVTGNVNITNFNRTAGATNLEFQQGVIVGGNMTIANTNGDDVMFAEGTLNAITGNLNVNKTNVIFGKSTENNVGGNIDVDADGKMEFQLNSLTAITNWFYNDGKVNIAPATSSSGSDVAARVTCAGFDHQGDENYWTNGSFPIIRR